MQRWKALGKFSRHTHRIRLKNLDTLETFEQYTGGNPANSGATIECNALRHPWSEGPQLVDETQRPADIRLVKLPKRNKHERGAQQSKHHMDLKKNKTRQQQSDSIDDQQNKTTPGRGRRASRPH